MRRAFSYIALILALLLAMPLQAYALYIAAEKCPMGAMQNMPSGDCGDCDHAGGCPLMSLYYQLQTAVQSDFGFGTSLASSNLLFVSESSAFRSFSLPPPDRPPRSA